MKARIAEVSEAGDRRRASRFDVALDARVRPLGEEGCEARILNISATGFMAATSDHYDVGSRIWLILPGRDRASALVKWIAGDKIGAEFAEPLALDGLHLDVTERS
jgi:hypothetical protein